MIVSPLVCTYQPVLWCRCERAGAAPGEAQFASGALNTFMKTHGAHVVAFNTDQDRWEFHSPVAKKAVVRVRTEPAVRGAFLQSREPTPVPVPR